MLTIQESKKKIIKEKSKVLPMRNAFAKFEDGSGKKLNFA